MKENSAKSIAVGIAVKIVLLAVLVLVLIFTGRRAYTFGYQIFYLRRCNMPQIALLEHFSNTL